MLLSPDRTSIHGPYKLYRGCGLSSCSSRSKPGLGCILLSQINTFSQYADATSLCSRRPPLLLPSPNYMHSPLAEPFSLSLLIFSSFLRLCFLLSSFFSQSVLLTHSLSLSPSILGFNPSVAFFRSLDHCIPLRTVHFHLPITS